jgi:putative iron-regulated protein
VYHGSYTRLDGSTVSGASLYDLIAQADAQVADQLKAEIATSVKDLGAIVTAAENGMAYDMMLARDNAEGEALILGAVNALVAQTRSIERAVAVLNLGDIALEGSDSLDAPDAVFQ